MLQLARFLLAICVVAWTTSSTAIAQLAPVGPDWVTQRPQEGGFRLLSPPNWQRRTPRGPNVKILLASPGGGIPGLSATAFANCNVVARNLDGTLSRSDTREVERAISSRIFTEAEWRDLLGEGINNIQITERRMTRVSNIPSQFSVISGSRENLNWHIWVNMLNIIFVDRNRTYHAVCSAGDGSPQGAQRAFEFWRPTLMAILGTLVIENW